jgi:hypothetical protein
VLEIFKGSFFEFFIFQKWEKKGGMADILFFNHLKNFGELVIGNG